MKSLKEQRDLATLIEGDSRYVAQELLQDINPELIREGKVDMTKSDIYSLGISLYEIMVGKQNQLPGNG